MHKQIFYSSFIDRIMALSLDMALLSIFIMINMLPLSIALGQIDESVSIIASLLLLIIVATALVLEETFKKAVLKLAIIALVMFLLDWNKLLYLTGLTTIAPFTGYRGLYVLLMLYQLVFGLWMKRTPAQAFFKHKIVNVITLEAPSRLRMLARALALTVFPVGIIFIFLNEQRRAFHDFVAGTVVIKE